VKLTAASGQPVTVAYTTAAGTAVAGADFIAKSGTLTFAPGVATLNVMVTVSTDTASEPDETFAVNLSSPTNAILTDAQALGTIRNDDWALSINDAIVTEGAPSATKNLRFTVRLSATAVDDVSVAYATSNVTATAGADYVAASGLLTIPAGSTTGTIDIAILGDALDEDAETFKVTLSAPTNAILSSASSAVGTINDANPVPPVVQVVAGRLATKKKTVTGIVLEVNGGIDWSRARSLANYRLVSAGHDRKFGTRDDKVVRLRGATFTEVSRLITLTAAGRSLALGTAMRLTLNCSINGLLDLSGRPIDGDRDGLPGGDFVASVTRKTVTALRVHLATQ
jgi:Calx-beta domain